MSHPVITVNVVQEFAVSSQELLSWLLRLPFVGGAGGSLRSAVHEVICALISSCLELRQQLEKLEKARGHKRLR